MMRGRGDQLNSRRRITKSGNVLIHLMAGELSSFPRLGSLRNLDLELPRIDKVLDGHTESGGCNLLNRAVFGVAVGERLVVFRGLAAFPCGAFSSHPVHGNRPG